jgi:hypothetical protein
MKKEEGEVPCGVRRLVYPARPEFRGEPRRGAAFYGSPEPHQFSLAERVTMRRHVTNQQSADPRSTHVHVARIGPPEGCRGRIC